MVKLKSYRELNSETQKLLNDLNLEILGSDISERLINLLDKPNLLAVIAYKGNKPIGFKLGFSEPENVKAFYSWAGGVKESTRGLGVASKLMEEQHSLLKKMNVEEVSTKCRDDRTAMIELNKKFGFKLKESYQSIANPEFKKHLFVKKLT